jgi:hypothetical protein
MVPMARYGETIRVGHVGSAVGFICRLWARGIVANARKVGVGKMTRKDFNALAWQLYNRAEEIDEQYKLETDERYFRQREWDQCVLAVANACGGSNANFDRGRFLRAAGYAHRPDGSRYPHKA